MTLAALNKCVKNPSTDQLSSGFYNATRPPCNTISLEPEAWLEIKVKVCMEWAFEALRVNTTPFFM